jgi:hypothetical protein
MIVSDDLYVATSQQPLQATAPSTEGGGPVVVTYGQTIIRYEVRQVMDVRNSGNRPVDDLQAGLLKPSYVVTCTQRVILPNLTAFTMAPAAPGKSDTWQAGYLNYPVLLTNTITPGDAGGAGTLNLRLVKYSPRTLNGSVGTTSSQAEAKSSGANREHTSGSSDTDTHSWNVEGSLGFFGMALTGGGSGGYSSGSSHTDSTSDAAGSSSSASRDVTVGDSMSVKDWAAFVQLDGQTLNVPTWVWGQEYPWDAVQFRPVANDHFVELPPTMEARLYEPQSGTGDSLMDCTFYPPSHLSLFGVDFTMKASWMVDLPGDLKAQTLTLGHLVRYAQGSHGIYSGSNVPALKVAQDERSLDALAPTTLNLTLLGLDPILDGSGRNGAAIGFFAKEKFISAPESNPSDGAFKILSDANRLQVSGSGFDEAMHTTFRHDAQAVVSLDFKIVDTDVQYSLFLKHWNANATGVTLTIVINGVTSITRHVDAMEGEGGEENLTTVSLRNQSYSSIAYHDYLQVGHNHIDITIAPDTPSDGGPPAGYYLRALAIGED